MAANTGETTAKALTRKDSVLASALRQKGEMGGFLMRQRNFGRRHHYGSLTNESLLSHALGVAKAKGFEYLSQLQVFDSPLYDSLRDRQLTIEFASQAGFKGKGRKTGGNQNQLSPKKESRKLRYASLTDSEILEKVRETEVVGSKNLIAHDSVLYAAVMQRPDVRRRLTELGWRRKILRWEEMSLDDWVELCGQFDTKDQFHRNYTAGYKHASASGLWNDICYTLTQRGKWLGIYGFDGRGYDSRAECIVANWLHISGVSYRVHPLLPWGGSKRRYQADFELAEFPVWIEVFLGSLDGLKRRTDAPSWAPAYIHKRMVKEANYATHREKSLIAIEAEVYRYEGVAAYLDHIRERFAKLGIELVEPGIVRLDLGNDRRGIFWTLKEFLEYAELNNIEKISELDGEGHRDLYAVLTSRDMRDDFRRALDEKHGRLVHAEGRFKMSLVELRRVCQELKIASRTEYEEAHKARRLPVGAPASIRQSYGVNWATFINGKGRSEFWPWEQAREYVRSRGFKSREEFLRAVRSDVGMRYIKRNPSNPISGGYSEFTDWYDFLGKAVPAHREGSVLETLS